LIHFYKRMTVNWNTVHLAAGAPEPDVDPNVITVYNMRFCPFAQRTMLVLLEKKVPFNVVNINLSKKPEWFLANTWGTVSVVRHKGAHIMESLVNSDYIDELFPETQLHSRDPLEKAQGRLLVEKFSKIIPKFYGILKAERPEADKIFEEMKALLTGLDAHLGQKGQRFLSGEKVGMPDLMLWPWVERMGCLDVRHPGMKVPEELVHLKSWISSMWEVESVKKYGLSTATHSKFYGPYLSGGVPDYDILLSGA